MALFLSPYTRHRPGKINYYKTGGGLVGGWGAGGGGLNRGMYKLYIWRLKIIELYKVAGDLFYFV